MNPPPQCSHTPTVGAVWVGNERARAHYWVPASYRFVGTDEHPVLRGLATGGSERVLLLFARYSGREDIRALAQEEAAIEAEDILTQAEEASAL